MPYLTITEAGVAKFYEILRSGTDVNIRHGNVFSEGDKETQSFATEQDAADFVDITVAEKKKAGFASDDNVFNFKRSSTSATSSDKPSKIGGDIVTMATLKKFLEKYTEVFEEIEEIDDLDFDIIKSSEYFLEYIDTDDYIGYDFSKYPTHKLMDNGCGDFFSGIIDINKTAAGIASGKIIGLDECPIYIFNLDDPKDEPRPAGNFKEYISTLLNGYIEYQDVEHIKAARKALRELQKFSSEKVDIDVPMSCDLFARNEDA